MFLAKAIVAISAVVATAAVVWACFVPASRPREVLADRRQVELSRAGNESRFSFLVTSEESGGKYVTMSGFVRPGTPGYYPGKSGSPPMHSHDLQEECFVVKAGRMGYSLDGKEGVAQVGDSPLCMPPRVPHLFWNFDNTTALDVECKITPPSNSEQFFLTYAGLAQDYGSLDKVNPLQILVTFVGGHLVLTDFPKPEWLFIKHVLVPVARFFKIFQPFYAEYTG